MSLLCHTTSSHWAIVLTGPGLGVSAHCSTSPWRVRARHSGLAERERVGLDGGIKEGDLESAVGDEAGLTNQLVQPMSPHRSVASIVDIDPMRRSRRLSVDEHAESHWRVRFASPMTG
jgi:hypothetical protein